MGAVGGGAHRCVLTVFPGEEPARPDIRVPYGVMSPARKSSGSRSFLRPVPAPAPAGKVADRIISDDELIEAVVAGDASVASELYDRLHHSVDRTIYRVLGRREGDHEDLVQTAFEQIVKTLATRRFARACSLSAWASTVPPSKRSV